MEKPRTMDLPPHEFEHYMMQEIDPLITTVDNEGLVNLLEVYAYDFIFMSNNTIHAHLLQVSRTMLHGIHAILPPPEVTGHNGFEPVALYKMEKVEGTWEHIKEILGWIMDGQKGTIQLPFVAKNGDWILVESCHIIADVRANAKILKLDLRAIDPDLVQAHYIQGRCYGNKITLLQ